MAWRHAHRSGSAWLPDGFKGVLTPQRGWHFPATLASLEQALTKLKANEFPWINKLQPQIHHL